MLDRPVPSASVTKPSNLSQFFSVCIMSLLVIWSSTPSMTWIRPPAVIGRFVAFRSRHMSGSGSGSGGREREEKRRWGLFIWLSIYLAIVFGNMVLRLICIFARRAPSVRFRFLFLFSIQICQRPQIQLATKRREFAYRPKYGKLWPTEKWG